ncbi:twin-arginine translocation signal domain-containing protein [Halomarina pelagica]|uniref:twin-arginine translocation signal domain-containing protein n=1 Tax=Halomarina pelagica TaxID=2961599 RepID=UPI0020C215E5|nr:twin-arginine translocation signal domain-containing protein [Halomarina sp. BND7]
MNRRRFVATAGAAVASLTLAGCTEYGTDNPGAPSGDDPDDGSESGDSSNES